VTPQPAAGIAIHTDRDDTDPERRITAFDTRSGRIVARGRKVLLDGVWSLRQYNNDVPCGATVVLYSSDPTATWEVVK
jgi:hypothetical protein